MAKETKNENENENENQMPFHLKWNFGVTLSYGHCQASGGFKWFYFTHSPHIMSIHQAGWATCDLCDAIRDLRDLWAAICELWVASAAEQLINKWNGNNNAGPWPQHAPLPAPHTHTHTVTSSLPVGCAGKLRARTTKFTILWESGGWWCDAIRKIDGDGDGDGGQTWTDSSWHCRSAKPKPNEDASAQLIETKKKAIYTHTYIRL